MDRRLCAARQAAGRLLAQARAERLNTCRWSVEQDAWCSWVRREPCCANWGDTAAIFLLVSWKRCCEAPLCSAAQGTSVQGLWYSEEDLAHLLGLRSRLEHQPLTSDCRSWCSPVTFRRWDCSLGSLMRPSFH